MGHPKKQRKKYETPPKPWDRARIEREKKLRQEFGLRRKKEIWRAESVLRNFRRRARELQARKASEAEKQLLAKLSGIGISCEKLEDVLEVRLEDMLSRRLQTLLFRKGIASSPKQARQLITHGHVSVAGRRVLWPSYTVQHSEEESISLDAKISTAIAKEEKQ